MKKVTRVVGALSLVILLAATTLIVVLLKQRYPVEQSASIRSYIANIDYESAGYGTYNSNALNSPNIGAVDVNLNWFRVEPKQGTFNFAPADKEIATWAQHGKKFTLIIRYVNESGNTTLPNCSGPQYLPSWEIPRILHFCDSDKGIIIPDYFDPTFKADIKAYIKVIADHFAISLYKDDLLYVRIGVGLAGEGFPLVPCKTGCDYQADRDQLVAWGYSPLAWKAWQEEMMSYFKSTFTYSTIIYPINQLETDPTTEQPVQMEVAYWAAAQGMGVGQEGLAPGYPKNYAEIKTILSYIQSHYSSTYIQFQTVALVRGLNEVQGDIDTARQYNARSIEWYANDAADPSYQSQFQQWQQIINNKFTE